MWSNVRLFSQLRRSEVQRSEVAVPVWKADKLITNTFVKSVARARFCQSDYPIRKKYCFLLYSLSVGLNTRTRIIGSLELQ